MTRVELARAEIARRRALAEAATAGPWEADTNGCCVGSHAADGWFVIEQYSRDDPDADIAHIAANDPAHVLRVLAAADAALDRHARTHTCQARWLDNPAAAGDDGAGRYIWPQLPCAETQAVLDLYAPQEAS
jgi:hypothetical protein